MLLNYTDLSPVKKTMEVEIPSERIAAEMARVTSEFGRQAKIPGFRQGKVPAGVVRSRFAKEIEEEVMSRLMPATFREAVAEKGVQPVGEPKVEHVDSLVIGGPVKYRVEFEVRPQFEVRDYKGIEIDDPKIEVTESDVEAMIERLREQASAYRLETERALEAGDYAMIDIGSTAEEMEPQTDTGHVKMGEETPLPELHDAIMGKRVGDTVSFDKSYDEEAKNEAFRGKNVHHEVTVREIRVQEKPELNDELAKSAGGWETVEAMREAISNDIRRHREMEAMRLKKNQVGDRLIASHEMEVPESMVEEELGKSLNNYARFLASQGVDLEKAELDWRKVAEEFRPEAIKRVKRSLILDEIAKVEGILASDVEVDAEIRRATSEQDRDFAEVKHRLRHDGGYEELRASLAREKAIDFVLHEARTK
jgi:trigger factor